MSSIPHSSAYGYDDRRGPQPPWAGRTLDPRQQRTVDRLQRLAWLLDNQFRIPGTDARIGWDGIVGLFPVVGDTASFVLSAYIVWEAKRLGVPRWTLLKMIGNIVLDWLVGSIPVLGSIFDFAFKANLRNLQLLGLVPPRSSSRTRP